jgi:iron(II)-dependent oxidoreductase
VSLVAVAVLAALVAGPPPAAHADGIMLVPAGAFWMGRDGATPDEAPRHRVYVTDFWIDRHKVTNAEFATFLDARGWVSAERERRYDVDDGDARIHRVPAGPPPHPKDGQPARWVADAGFEHHPVAAVSWFGARDYCEWKGRRLPTEAEWEKAARGVDERLYPWGDEAPGADRAVFGRGYNATLPTGGRPAGASPYGVEDLLGNLREWTATILRPYPYRKDDGREPFTGVARRENRPARRADAPERRADAPERVVVRGASHDDPLAGLSLTLRHSHDRRGAAAGHHDVGFRCATSEDLGGY